MSLSLEQKVGQVFMFGFPSKDPEGARELVENLHAGGISYFARNLDTVAQAAALSETLQGWALASPPGLPLLLAADQEGGIVARLTKGIPLMPGPMSLAAASMGLARIAEESPRREPALNLVEELARESLVRQVHKATGIQLRAAGVNMNLAPDLDVNDNPDNPVIGVRSFGGDPELVSRLGVGAIQGLLSAGVIPVGKHFPGHGNTSVDSHLDLPILPHSMERLHRVELAPFRTAIAGGLPVIMTAHIVFLAIDPDRPATLSEEVLQGLLRRDLGFQGLIVTDCMEMAAIGKNPGTVRGAVLALKAGADMVLISHTRELQVSAYEAVLEAVRSGELPESRLDEAVERILAVKRAVGLPNPLPTEEATRLKFWALSRESHLASITVVKDDDHLLPLSKTSAIPRNTEQLTESFSSSRTDDPLRLLLVYAKGSAQDSSLSPLGQALAQEGVMISEVYLEATERQDDSDPTAQVGADIMAGRGDASKPTMPYNAGDQTGKPSGDDPTGGEGVDYTDLQGVQSHLVGQRKDDANLVARVKEASALADVVVVLTRNAASDETQAHRASAVVRAVASSRSAVSPSGPISHTAPGILSDSSARTDSAFVSTDGPTPQPIPCVLVATGNPHDLKVVPGVGTYVCTYSHKPEAMAALAKILLGHRKPVGEAPVVILGGV